jgi:hypothetical protein
MLPEKIPVTKRAKANNKKLSATTASADKT